MGTVGVHAKVPNRQENDVVARRRGGARTVQIHPDAEALEKLKASLPKFGPLDTTHLFEQVRQEPFGEADIRIDEVVELMDGQLNRLLTALGLDPVGPEAWRRGFFLLAMLHHGAAHITYNKSAPPNRNAAKSTSELDRLLYDFVREYEKKGVDPMVALQSIAEDPEKCRQLRLSPSWRSQTPDAKLRFEALRKRWARIKKMAPPGSLLAAFTGDYPIYGTDKDKTNWRPNLTGLEPLIALGKSKPPSKS